MVPQGKSIWPLSSRLYASTSGLVLLSPCFDDVLREERTFQAWETREVYPGARQVLHHFMHYVQFCVCKEECSQGRGVGMWAGFLLTRGRAYSDQIVLSILSTILLLTDKSRLPPPEGIVSSYCDDFHCLIRSRALGLGGIALQTLCLLDPLGICSSILESLISHIYVFETAVQDIK